MERKILGVILARGGSKGVPRKNIRELGGKPLIQYIFEAARKSKYITKLIMSTEDEEIANVGKSIGIEVAFMRPAELATDNATGISVIKHALKFFDDTGFKADGVFSLQPTNPFTSTQTIDIAVELWLDKGCDSVTTIAKVNSGHPYITKRLKEDNVIENFSSIPEGISMHIRQDREKAYYMTGALYLRSRSLVEAENMDSHYLGKDSRAVVVDEIEAIDINTLFDFEFAEWMVGRSGNNEK
jgi:CMP-N-acetylneuraminic acid synthetase